MTMIIIMLITIIGTVIKMVLMALMMKMIITTVVDIKVKENDDNTYSDNTVNVVVLLVI